MDFLRKHQVKFLYGILFFFLITIAANFGGNLFMKGAPNDTAIEVDGENVTFRIFNSHYQRALDQLQGAALNEDARRQKREETVRDLVQSVVFKKQIDRYGIFVPDQQVAISLAQVPAFQTEGKFDPQKYMQGVQSMLHTNIADFEEEQRLSIGFFKLRWLIQSTIKVTDSEVKDAFAFAGTEFAKTNEFVTDEKGKKRKLSPEELRQAFRQKYWDDKVLWAFNQWFTQLGQKLKVKTHLESLEGGKR